MAQTDATTQPASDATMVDNPRIVRRRKPVLILTAASLLCSLVSLIDNFFTYGYSGYDNINQYALHFKTITLQNVLFIILNVLEIAPAALLMFCMKNRIPCVLSASPEQEKASLAKMRPEKALKQLDEQYEFGLISADTFRSLRVVSFFSHARYRPPQGVSTL